MGHRFTYFYEYHLVEILKPVDNVNHVDAVLSAPIAKSKDEDEMIELRDKLALENPEKRYYVDEVQTGCLVHPLEV